MTTHRAERDRCSDSAIVGKFQEVPPAMFQKVTDRVVQTETVHDQDNAGLNLVAQGAEQLVRVPLLGTFAGCFRIPNRHSAAA
jgi:hypothetical protein